MTEDKTKVKDLATELGVPTKNLLQALRELDIPAKSTSSNIAAEDIDRVKNHLKDSATSEQGDRREVQPGVIVRRRRQSTEDVAAEGEEAPRAERRAPRENHTPTARIVSVPGASEAQDAAPVPSAEPEAPAAPEVSVQEPVKEGAEEKPAPVAEADKADDQKPRQPRDNRQKKRSGLREAAPVAKVISRPPLPRRLPPKPLPPQRKLKKPKSPARRNPPPPRGPKAPPRLRCCLRSPKATVPALPMARTTIAATVASRAVPRNRPRRRSVLFPAPTPRP